jgi:hypothetical protein
MKETHQKLMLLCRGDAAVIAGWLRDLSPRWMGVCALVIVVGCWLYGLTIGLWRAPLQGFFVALKFPLLIFLTCLGNGIINGMLAQLLDVRLSFRQTSAAILFSFTLAAMILAAFSPVTLFILYNTPPLESGRASTGHSVILLSNVALIAYAGVLANYRLYQLLIYVSHSVRAARSALFCWLAGNLLLGSQLAWILRPYIGSPNLPVQFFREDPLRGNFFEAVWAAIRQLTT